MPHGDKHRAERQHEGDVVELSRMTSDAVTEIHAPRQRSRHAEGVIVQACQKAADSTDNDARDQRHHKSIAGRALDTAHAFGDLDAAQSSDQTADNRLPGKSELRRTPVQAYEVRIFHPNGELAAQDGSNETPDGDSKSRAARE